MSLTRGKPELSILLFNLNSYQNCALLSFWEIPATETNFIAKLRKSFLQNLRLIIHRPVLRFPIDHLSGIWPMHNCGVEITSITRNPISMMFEIGEAASTLLSSFEGRQILCCFPFLEWKTLRGTTLRCNIFESAYVAKRWIK